MTIGMENETEMPMNPEIAEIKINIMQEDISEIKEQLKALPNEIAEKLNETLELKMQVKISNMEKRFFKWVTGLTIGIISCLVGLVIKYILG